MSNTISVSEYFHKNYQVQDENLLKELERVTEVIKTREGDILMVPGEVPSKIMFHVDGITRGYFVDDRGHEHTECFGGQYFLPLMPCGEIGEPSSITLEVTEAGTIFAVPVDQVGVLSSQYPEMHDVIYRILAHSAKANAEIRKILYLYDATQRYQWFVKSFPDICDRVSQKHAASFLNMTPETYCRIKKSEDRKAGSDN